ncbi:MAG: L-histidine N(alpha)-methyltransferase [Gemmatimonadales bacterium]
MFEPAEAVDGYVQAQVDREALIRDVARGLALPQKELDPKYFYDERGSELFELITELPEYYLTRAERAVLKAEMPALVAWMRPRSLVELGAGSANKTRIILDAMKETGNAGQYVPVDVSRDFLELSAGRLRESYPALDIVCAVGDFTGDLVLPRVVTPALFAFLGSTIGNFEEQVAVGILKSVVRHMRPGDLFLLGADLRKDPEVIEAAYNDSAGVTAEFNINVLRVLNRELDADFDLAGFSHRAIYNRDMHRIEMHLDSLRDQTVTIPNVGAVLLERGESIRTELSCKYDRGDVEGLFTQAGLRLDEWMTGDDNLFALAVGSVVRTPV